MNAKCGWGYGFEVRTRMKDKRFANLSLRYHLTIVERNHKACMHFLLQCPEDEVKSEVQGMHAKPLTVALALVRDSITSNPVQPMAPYPFLE